MLGLVQLARLSRWWPLFAAAAFVLLIGGLLTAWRNARTEPLAPSLVLPGAPAGELDILVQASALQPLDAGGAGQADAGVCSQNPAMCAALETSSLRAVGGASVRLFRVCSSAGHYEAAGEVVTDASGKVRLPLGAGAHWLLIDAEGWARHAEPIRFEGGVRALTVRLSPALPLSVTVRGPQARPIAGAQVAVQSSDVLPHLESTLASGVAEFGHVGVRLERVRVSAPGYDEQIVYPSGREIQVTLELPLALEVLVVDTRGQPVEGARVSLAGAMVWPARQIVTGAQGVARVEGLSAGLYDLRAELGSLVSKSATGVSVSRSEPSAITLELEPGHFVNVSVAESGADGLSPVAGAEVSVVEGGLGPFPLRGQSDEAGQLRLGPLPLGSASLNVHARGFMSESGVSVDTGQPHDVAIQLLRAGRLSGQVLDAEGSAIEGATLEVVGNDLHGRPIARRSELSRLPANFFDTGQRARQPFVVPLGELGVVPGPLPLPGMLPFAPAPSSAWVSDLEGRFHLEEVPPGRLQMLARHPDFVAATSEVVVLAPGGEAFSRVVLGRGAALEGRVVDEYGRPVARARVDAVASHATGHDTALTQSDGYFAFGAVATEVDLFVARPSDRYRFVMRSAVALSVGERRELTLKLPRERSPVVVLVTDDLGEPLIGAQVTVLSLDPEVPLRMTLPSDSRGRVQIEDAAGLRCTLRVSARGFRPFTLPLEALPPQLSVGMDRGISAIGWVTVVRGRQALPGARVVLTQAGERKIESAGVDGAFRFDDVAPGAAELEVSHPDYSTEQRSITIAPASDPEQPVELAPIELDEAGAIEGRVVDAAGVPVSGARVGIGFVPAFLPAGPVSSEIEQTDSEGRFSLSGVPVGRVKLSAYAAGFGRGALDGVEVRPSEATEGVEIQLHGGEVEQGSEALASLAVTLGERGRDAGIEVVIMDVANRSEAERAGLRAGDVVVAVDGVPVDAMLEARRLLGGSDGSDVVLELERNGEGVSLRVRREAVRR